MRPLPGAKSASSATWTFGWSNGSNSAMTIGIVEGVPPRCVSRRFMSGVCSVTAHVFIVSMSFLKSRANCV